MVDDLLRFDNEDDISLTSLSYPHTSSPWTQEPLQSGSRHEADEDMQPLSPTMRSTAASPLNFAGHEASNSGHSDLALDSDNHRTKAKPIGSRNSSQHRQWLATITNPLCEGIKRWCQGHQYVKIWWWEALCCITSLGALLAIVATIRTHESKELPQWRYGLTVNAIIAIYTVILKAAAGLVLAEGISHLKWIAVAREQSLATFVAHDAASRGPWGSLSLLWKNQYSLRTLHASPYISSLGALITVSMLLLDPFSQQIIRTYQCERQVIGINSSIARTNIYREIWRSNAVPIPIRDAINNGLFASQKPDPTFNCSTGDCIFAEKYMSAAYCSSCTDLTDQLKFTQYEVFDRDLNQSVSCEEVSLPRGNTAFVTLTRGGVACGQIDIALQSFGYSEDEVDIIRWNERSKDDSITGYRCRFYPCVKTYRANVTTGRMVEEVVEETSDDVFSLHLPSASENVWSTADLDCLDSPDQRKMLKKLGYRFNDTTRWLPYNISLVDGTVDRPVYTQRIYGSDPCEKEDVRQFPELCNGNKMSAKAHKAVPARCIYNIGYNSVRMVYQLMIRPMFTGQVQYLTYSGDGAEALKAVYFAGTGSGTLKDVQDTVRSITDSFTTHMRQAGQKGSSEPAVGVMYTDASCIQVRWAWLAHAALVVGLLVIFFVWMVVYGRVSQLQLQKQWTDQDSVPPGYDFKSSALDLLFHGLDGETLRHLQGTGASNQEKELEQKAKQVTVRLVATEQGWKLSSIDS